MADKVILRNDTIENWNKYNPILSTGEIGIEIDGTNRYKIGDGIHHWNELPYPVTDVKIVQKIGNDSTAVMSQDAVTREIKNVQIKVDNDITEQENKLETTLNSQNNKIESTLSTQDKKINDFKKTIENQINSYKPVNIQGNVNNAADEEDLTAVNGLLQLKDRNTLNGMGYIILRRDKTFVEQLTQANTIYEIRYDFDLGGENVEIPENCVLKFEGGCLKNGGISFNNTLVKCNQSQCFHNVKTKGTLLNNRVCVSWYGLFSDNPTIDCTPIVKEFIQPLNKAMFFEKGTYYFSEYHVCNSKEDTFAIIGDNENNNFGLNYKTIFKPFNNNQRYIIKIGGGVNCFGKDESIGSFTKQRGYNIKIENIHFSNDYSYRVSNIENPLTNNYSNASVDYGASLLILDVIEIGQFSFSGSPKHIPLATFGYIYECNFDFISCYGNEGKSDLPVIQIINNIDNTPISACSIKKCMFEVIVGSVFKCYNKSAVVELTIGEIYYENSIGWSSSANNTEERVDFSTINPNDYNTVPLFDLCGTIGININYFALNGSNSIYWNKYDHNEESWDGTTKDTMRSFCNFDSNNIQRVYFSIGTIVNGGWANKQYVTGGFLKSDINLKISRICEISFIPLGDAYYWFNGEDEEPKENYSYKDKSLNNLARTTYISGTGYLPSIKHSDGITYISNISGNRPIFGSNFKNNKNIKYIDITCRTQNLTQGYFSIYLALYDDVGNELKRINFVSRVVQSWDEDRRYIVRFPDIDYNSFNIIHYTTSAILIKSISFNTENNPPCLDKDEDLMSNIQGIRKQTNNGVFYNNGLGFSSTNIDVIALPYLAKKILKIELSDLFNEFIVKFGVSGHDNTIHISTFRKVNTTSEIDVRLCNINSISTVSALHYKVDNKYIIELSLSNINMQLIEGYVINFIKSKTIQCSLIDNTESEGYDVKYMPILGSVVSSIQNYSSVITGTTMFLNRDDKKIPIWWNGEKWVDAIGNNVDETSE